MRYIPRHHDHKHAHRIEKKNTRVKGNLVYPVDNWSQKFGRINGMATRRSFTVTLDRSIMTRYFRNISRLLFI